MKQLELLVEGPEQSGVSLPDTGSLGSEVSVNPELASRLCDHDLRWF